MSEKNTLFNLIEKIHNQPYAKTNDDLTRLAASIPLFLPLRQENLIPAAVVIPFILHENNPSLLLTQRTKHLKRHAGQISFPGGKCEDEDALTCALRETQEEVGLLPENINVISALGQWPSYSGYLITPFLATIKPPLAISHSLHEVEEVFEVPLTVAFDTSLYQRIDKQMPIPHHYFELMYQQKQIWGFTASVMLLLATYAKATLTT